MTKNELIEKYRFMNVDCGYDWWESIEEDLRSDMDAIGFTVDKMYFSGFWSQGDGACFTGRMYNWTLFCDKMPEFVRDFPYLSEYLKDAGANYTVAHRGSYYHENCTIHTYGSDLEWYTEQDYDPDDPRDMMRQALSVRALTEEANHTNTGVYDWLKDYFKDKMRELYRDLEKEYDYLTSDEAVWETIVANELDKELEDADEEKDTESADWRGRVHDCGV